MSDIDPNLPPETDPVPPVADPPVEPAPADPPAPKPEETVEFWKNKFSESSAEAQRLLAADKAREQAAQELTKEPTDSDYRAAFPDWDALDESQKSDKRRILNAERTAQRAALIAQNLQSKDSWNTSIELAITSNPALQGNEDAFRKYASKPQYKDAPMDLLVSSFLGTKKDSTHPAPATPRPGLEPGSGGPRETPKPKGLSMAELDALRTSDYRAYEKYIKSHDITIDE